MQQHSKYQIAIANSHRIHSIKQRNKAFIYKNEWNIHNLTYFLPNSDFGFDSVLTTPFAEVWKFL